ncbi:response regulator [Buttiauxella gaviniae]|uniref:response regulator n=1 Tax=Buttiauxella gaviniae TaxID=82990 RepID=UPI003974B02F
MNASSHAIRVALLDDHQLILSGLSNILAQDPDIIIEGMFTNSQALLDCLQMAPVNVLVMDYELAPADSDGVNLIKMLRLRHPTVGIVVVSSHYNPATVSQALRAGALGFIGKNRSPELIQSAIRNVSRGVVFIEKEMSELISMQYQNKATFINNGAKPETIINALALAALSPKEQEVVRCFMSGMTVSEIAEKFNRSLKTISGQKQSAMRKLGLTADHQLWDIKDELLKILNS